jgi:hypothetical protein
MFKTIRDMLLGAFVCAAVGAAVAGVGIPPGTGPQLVDGAWLNGLAGGQNYTYQSGITAHAGGGQTACLVLGVGISFFEVDTVASGNDSVCLPYAQAGMDFQIRNAAASNSMNIFAQSTNNPSTAAGDTINGSSNSSSYALAAGSSVECFAAKNGVWSCVHGS